MCLKIGDHKIIIRRLASTVIMQAIIIMLLIDKHPEIKKLMGPEPKMKYLISILMVVNLFSAYVTNIANLSYFWTTVLAYCFAGCINHLLLVCIHDLSHNVGFGNSRPVANRLLGIWSNLPIVVPMSVSFKKYHVLHHRSLDIDGYDTDLPTNWEDWLFNIPPAGYFSTPFTMLFDL